MPRKSYDQEFKRQAVDLAVRSGKPVAQVARELGVSVGSLHLWKRQLLAESQAQDGAAGGGLRAASGEELYREIRRLQKENQYLKTQREILKKAMSILGEIPPSDMR